MKKSINRKWKSDGDIKYLVALDKQRFNERWGRTIPIHRHEYDFVWCDEIEHSGKKCAGLCDPDAKKIYIDVNYENIEVVLLHEIFHAEMGAMGYRSRNDYDPNLEEMIVDNLGEAVHHNFRLVRRKP